MAEEQEKKAPANTVTIEEVGPCKKKVLVEVPAESIKETLDQQYSELRRDAVLPGFRKGRAPRRLLEKRFGKETSEQVKLKLLGEASDAALKDNELQILGDPDIDFENIELPADGPLKFEFEVEVWPEFELPELEGIPVNRVQSDVTDEQVEGELSQLRKYSGVWTPREQGGAVELDDRIVADAVLNIEDVAEEEKLDNTEIHVRKHGFVGGVPIEGLDELLIGSKPGDTKTTEIEVPKTYFREEYRGKKVVATIQVKDVKWLKPADLDEAFLERYHAEDESQLRENLKDMLQGRQESQTRSDMSEQIHKYLLDNITFDLPLDVVAQQATTVLQRQYVRLLTQGLPKEQLEEQMEALRSSSEEQAKEQLKTFFIMDKVSDKLGIELSDEEVNGHIAQVAIQRGQRPERMREQMERDGSLSQFKLEIRQSKCITKLLETAKITETEAEKPARKAAQKAPAKKTPKKTSKKAAKKSKDKEDD
jgi:trigger factor